ncbi:MAG: efflux RND transporter periplasmic adaptor subunit [Pirellulales bacterium]|nr:efflux RND transporter periplasmic adaptor subunit [Pirellulales bacterium]
MQEAPLVEAISTNGEVVYDQSRVAHLSSRVAGTAWQVEKQVGDRVAAGELLALVEAADVGRAKSELLRAISESRLKHATINRLRPLADQQIIPVGKFREAEAELQQSEINLQAAEQVLANYGLPVDVPGFGDADTAEIRRRIQFLGLPDDAVDRISASVTTSNLFPVRSPIAGTVVEREVVAGEVIDTTTQLFTVADDSQMWLILHVRQEDAQYVRPGQSVLFQTTVSAGELKGQVRWVSTETDEQTRTVEVRAEIPNADRNLRSNTFGVGRIVLRDEATAIVVPDDAVHWDGCCHVVFVRDKDYFEPNAPKFFHVRKVRLGVKEAGTTEIIAGLLPGEVIATRNSVVLEAQLLKANLGAGCCEACAPKKEK